MAFVVQQAKKKALKLRMSIAGPSGSGKTTGALRVAYGLCGDWSKIVVIDTNIDDSLVYAGDTVMGIGEFSHIPMTKPFSPKRFIEAINAALDFGAEVVVIDSASDEWAGPGGMLEMHDQVKGYNSAANWAKVNPDHMEFIKAMVEQKRAHVIATFRQKSKVAIDEETTETGAKKSTVRRLGMENIARPGTEYDFLLAVELDRDLHKADIITKRGSMLPDMRPVELTEALGKRLRAWADAGEEGQQESRPGSAPASVQSSSAPTTPQNGKQDAPKDEQPAAPAMTIEYAMACKTTDKRPLSDLTYSELEEQLNKARKVDPAKRTDAWQRAYTAIEMVMEYREREDDAARAADNE